MQFNILTPKKSVQSCVDRPNLQAAFVLVLLPAFAAAAGTLLLGFSVNLTGFFLSLARSVINWLFLCLVIYLVLYLVKGRFISGKFKSIGSALSLVWIVLILLFVASFLLLPVFVSAPVMEQGRLLQNGEITQEQFAVAVNSIVEQNPDALNENVGLVLAVVALLLALWMVYLVYLLVADLYQAGLFKNAIVTLFILAIWFFFVKYFYFR
ncbi:MAG: hypothetical protein V1777_03790 [Candidatus Micrarchaeota archaeon]